MKEENYIQNEYSVCHVTILMKFDLGGDYRLVGAKVNINTKIERNKFIKPHRSDELKQNKNKYPEYIRKKNVRL